MTQHAYQKETENMLLLFISMSTVTLQYAIRMILSNRCKKEIWLTCMKVLIRMNQPPMSIKFSKG